MFWTDIYGFLGWEHHPSPFGFRVSIENSGVIGPPLYVTFFSFEGFIFFIHSAYLVFWLLCVKRSFFSGTFYLVLCMLLIPEWVCLWLGYGNFLLWFYWKYFMCIWPRLLLLPFIVIFSLFIVSHVFCIFCDRNILDLAFSFTEVFICSIMSQCLQILSSTSFTLLVMFVSEVSEFLNFHFQIYLIWILFIDCIFHLRSWTVFFISFLCLCFYSFL